MNLFIYVNLYNFFSFVLKFYLYVFAQIDYPEAQSYRGRPRIQGGMPSMDRGVNLVLDDAVSKSESTLFDYEKSFL